tara:strand:- start:1737 stop:2216 length:480 start_codon:yes stop_codon:yes gene_type:complete
MRLTKRQLSLLVKEATAPGSASVLTEEELNEIAPMISMMARSLGSNATKAFAKTLEKGIQGVADYIEKNPEQIEKIGAMIAQSVDKLPGIQKIADSLGDNPDPGQLANAIANPPKEAEADLQKMFQGASDQLEKAEDCDCPSPDEEKGLIGKLGSFFGG